MYQNGGEKKIESKDESLIENQKVNEIYSADKANFNNFIDGKSDTLNFSSLKRLILSELTLNKSITIHKFCGFSRKQIINMAQYPERYGIYILKLVDYMYQKSGYMKRLVDYFSNMPKLNYYIDKEINDISFFKINNNSYKKNYIKFIAQASKLNLSNNINDIVKRMYLNDVCYAFIVENDIDFSYYFINPKFCKIRCIINGNVFGFSVDRKILNTQYIKSLPEELKNLLEKSRAESRNDFVDIPYDKGFCLKYNAHFLHLYPPFFPMIADILLIDEMKDLAKSKALNDAYKMLILKVPTKDGMLTMSDKIIKPFIETAVGIIQENIGVLPYPGDVESVEFSSSNSDDRDKVDDAVKQMYANMGVSESLMSGASSGSELKLSITNDAGDIYRIYRMLENWVSLQMKIRNFIYPSYQFVYKILDMTIFNQSDIVDTELKIAQASVPNKEKLCAACGISPSSLIGNSIHENIIFNDIYETWEPLKSSYTQSADTSEEGGRPVEEDIVEVTEIQRENDSNNTENRV